MKTTQNMVKSNNKIHRLLKLCIHSENKNTRKKYSKLIKEELNNIWNSYGQTIDIVNELIDKLTDASMLIKDQNEWMFCLYSAMDDKKEEIVHSAVIAQNTLSSYKKLKERKYNESSNE